MTGVGESKEFSAAFNAPLGPGESWKNYPQPKPSRLARLWDVLMDSCWKQLLILGILRNLRPKPLHQPRRIWNGYRFLPVWSISSAIWCYLDARLTIWRRIASGNSIAGFCAGFCVNHFATYSLLRCDQSCAECPQLPLSWLTWMFSSLHSQKCCGLQLSDSDWYLPYHPGCRVFGLLPFGFFGKVGRPLEVGISEILFYQCFRMQRRKATKEMDIKMSQNHTISYQI